MIVSTKQVKPMRSTTRTCTPALFRLWSQNGEESGQKIRRQVQIFPLDLSSLLPGDQTMLDLSFPPFAGIRLLTLDMSLMMFWRQVKPFSSFISKASVELTDSWFFLGSLCIVILKRTHPSSQGKHNCITDKGIFAWQQPFIILGLQKLGMCWWTLVDIKINVLSCLGTHKIFKAQFMMAVSTV